MRALSPDEVADILGVHRYTVYKLLKEGRLRGFRVSSRWRVMEADLEDYIRGREPGDNDDQPARSPVVNPDPAAHPAGGDPGA